MIYLIRHAESIGNAGARTDKHSDVPLSELGRKQAEILAQKIDFCPDLIVVSPFLRTCQTAQPLLQKYPNAPVEIWPVQEFSFLDHNRCRNTTEDDRRPLRQAYYARNDFDYVDGEGAESFNQLLTRVDGMLVRLRKLADKNVIVFTHGNFLRAVVMRTNKLPLTFETFLSLPIVENTAIVPLAL